MSKMMLPSPYLAPEDADFYNSNYNFARERIHPTVCERDQAHRWDKNLWEEIAATGVAGLLVPEQYGGQGGNCLQSAHAMEALVAGSGDNGLFLSVGAHAVIGTMPIVLFGTEEQKERYLPRLASGEWISAWGMTEPDSGSDAAGLRTRAVDRGDHFLVNGSKMFITNGPVADLVVALVRTKEGQSRSPLGISALIIERRFNGFFSGKPLIKYGMCTSVTSELIFEDVKVPKENLLGELNLGFTRVGHGILEWERIVLIAGTAGGVRFALERCLPYAIKRRQFGRPIIDYPAVQQKLAMIWVYMQVMTRICYSAASAKGRGKNVLSVASLAKIFITEAGEAAAREAMQILGGYGYIKEYEVERFCRDVRLGSIGGGSSEVMRMIVSSMFPDWERLTEALQLLAEEIHNEKGADATDGAASYKNFGQSLIGELELLQSIELLLKSLLRQPTKRPNQLFAFAKAEVIVVYTILKQAFWDCAAGSGSYRVKDKRRDFALLSAFLCGSYIGAIRQLHAVDPQNAGNVIQKFAALGDVSPLIDDCALFLKNWAGELSAV